MVPCESRSMVPLSRQVRWRSHRFGCSLPGVHPRMTAIWGPRSKSSSSEKEVPAGWSARGFCWHHPLEPMSQIQPAVVDFLGHSLLSTDNDIILHNRAWGDPALLLIRWPACVCGRGEVLGGELKGGSETRQFGLWRNPETNPRSEIQPVCRGKHSAMLGPCSTSMLVGWRVSLWKVHLGPFGHGSMAVTRTRRSLRLKPPTSGGTRVEAES